MLGPEIEGSKRNIVSGATNFIMFLLCPGGGKPNHT